MDDPKDPKANDMDASMVEGIDYYIDGDGLLVMTAAFHLKRGYCCDSGCKHCPYN